MALNLLAQCVKVMQGQGHCLALLFNSVPLHQFGQDVPGSLAGPHSQLFLANRLSLAGCLCRPVLLACSHTPPLQSYR